MSFDLGSIHSKLEVDLSRFLGSLKQAAQSTVSFQQGLKLSGTEAQKTGEQATRAEIERLLAAGIPVPTLSAQLRVELLGLPG